MNVARKALVGGCELRAKNAEIEDKIWPPMAGLLQPDYEAK